MARESLERLIALFNLVGNREIRRYCRDLVVTSEDLADVILVGTIAGLGPYRYVNHFSEIRHESLEPNRTQLVALGRSGVGPAKGDALKAIHKMDQIFLQRRLLGVHLFYAPSRKYWHMFYFDQRDYEATKNHWKHGPHIHYSQDTFTREPLSTVWQQAAAVMPTLPPSVHIRYDYHHNRRRGA